VIVGDSLLFHRGNAGPEHLVEQAPEQTAGVGDIVGSANIADPCRRPPWSGMTMSASVAAGGRNPFRVFAQAGSAEVPHTVRGLDHRHQFGPPPRRR
jgi:hypothetical protein